MKKKTINDRIQNKAFNYSLILKKINASTSGEKRRNEIKQCDKWPWQGRAEEGAGED
jgi:hypothetical protein